METILLKELPCGFTFDRVHCECIQPVLAKQSIRQNINLPAWVQNLLKMKLSSDHQSQNLFLLECAGLKPAGDKIHFLWKCTLKFAHGRFAIKMIKVMFSHVAVITESKSVSIEVCRFETCRVTHFFVLEHVLNICSQIASQTLIFISLSRVVTRVKISFSQTVTV
jgi:hypothetical protein